MSELELKLKTCPKCDTEKPISEFYRDRTRVDGASALCRVCGREQVRLSREKRRAEMGEEAWLRHQNEIRRRNYQKNPESNRLQNEAVRSAMVRLREAYREVYEQFLREERYERGLHVD